MKESRNWRGKPRPPAQLETRRPRAGKPTRKAPPPRAQVDLELLAAMRAWAGSARGESATDDALGAAERPGRFRLKGALDRLFRHYARLSWLLAQQSVPASPEMLWAACAIVVEGLDPEAVAKAVAVTTADVSGLARTLGRLKADDLQKEAIPEAVALECPDDLFQLLQAAFGPRLRQELTALNLPAPLDVRVNTLKTGRDELANALAVKDIELRRMPYAPYGLRARGRPDLAATDAFQSGLYEIQDEGSQLVSLILDVKSGQQVLDFCAGAGGKTLALAAAMENRGHLVAADVSQRRLARAKLRLKRAGAENAERILLTGRDDDPFFKRRAGWFDRVLVDAPCSGTGAWRRHPETKWQAGRDLTRLTVLQDAVLARAARLVKRGGRLVYATCSLLPQENEHRVQSFLAANPAFRLIPATSVWSGFMAIPWPCLTPDYLALTPAQHGTDGFFAAVMERIA